MVHRKKIYRLDYSSHLLKLERYVPLEIENALVISADEGAVPVWLFQNRPAFVTITSFLSTTEGEVNLENNLEEFSHSLCRLNGKHIDSIQILAELPTRYDFIFCNTVDSDCDDYALKLLAKGGVLIFQEYENFPGRTEDFRLLIGESKHKVELLSSSDGQWIIRKL